MNPDPLTSNVYSVGERILLAWINHHYNVQRNISWPAAIGGESCSVRHSAVDCYYGLYLIMLSKCQRVVFFKPRT